MLFWDLWLWVIFIAIGLVMVLMELLVGVETGFDLVILGTVFIIGGAATFWLNDWLITFITTGAICVLYIGIGRRYTQSRLRAKSVERTNIDAIIGQHGIVQSRIAGEKVGLVKVGYEVWRARAEEDIEEGEEIEVVGVRGVTLNVKRAKEVR
jgi:membrane protein implicated in regulation of membrane protease activity